MKKQKLTFGETLSKYHPNPGQAFYTRMENAPWKNKEPMMPNHPMPHTRFAWQLASGLLIVIVLLSLSIPAVRASLSAWLGLSVAPSNQAPANAVTLVAVTPLTPTAAKIGVDTSTPIPATITVSATAAATETIIPTQPANTVGRPAEINQLVTQAGWEILAPGHLPDGYHFESAYYDTNNKMVILTYLVTRPLPGASDPTLTASKTITVIQALKNDFVPMQIAPGTNVEDTQVNGQPAVYTIGAWDTEFVADAQDPNGGKMVSTWRNDLPIKNIYWQVGKVYLTLVTDDDVITKEELIIMAASTGK
jgi:hypothetical protein